MYVHGDNLLQKIASTNKYGDATSKKHLKEIKVQYDNWKDKNENLKGPFSKPQKGDGKILKERVDLFSVYKDYLDQQHFAEHFDSRSNLHSSVLEEFMYYLFKDISFEFSSSVLIGKAHTFKDIFFLANNFQEMVNSPNARIEKKDHDFVIGVNINADMNCQGQSTIENHVLQIPAVAIECKTYLDKTMLEGSSTSAEQLSNRNPNSLYIVVAEWLKLTETINLKKFKVDQIYILRKQKNTDREYRYDEGYVKNPIYLDVVEHLFDSVRKHLTTNWEGGISFGLSRGFLI